MHLLGLQVNPGKVSDTCVSQSPVVKSLKQILCQELLSVPVSLLFSCALAKLSVPRMSRSQRFFLIIIWADVLGVFRGGSCFDAWFAFVHSWFYCDIAER